MAPRRHGRRCSERVSVGSGSTAAAAACGVQGPLLNADGNKFREPPPAHATTTPRAVRAALPRHTPPASHPRPSAARAALPAASVDGLYHAHEWLHVHSAALLDVSRRGNEGADRPVAAGEGNGTCGAVYGVLIGEHDRRPAVAAVRHRRLRHRRPERRPPSTAAGSLQCVALEVLQMVVLLRQRVCQRSTQRALADAGDANEKDNGRCIPLARTHATASTQTHTIVAGTSS